MKKIEVSEQKEIMLNILKYFDKKCRENGIDYSLIGGSLIGAIREKGFIPWDDDIDVIMSKDNYLKIIDVLKKDNNKQFELLDSDNCDDYYFPFPKLVDTRTFVVEPMSLKQIKKYGIYIDIFCYNNVSDDERTRNKFIKRVKFINGLISRKKSNNMSFIKTIKNVLRNTFSTIIGHKRLIRIANKNFFKNDYSGSKYVISNWPIYKPEKELQLSNDIEEYIDVQFEDMKAMAFKNYDNVLKTTFGDYMTPPPEDKRVSHGLEAYWRDDKDEK